MQIRVVKESFILLPCATQNDNSFDLYGKCFEYFNKVIITFLLKCGKFSNSCYIPLYDINQNNLRNI